MANRKKKLTEFDGRDVLQATLTITKTGDGLSKTMAIDPAEYHIGEKLYVVMEVEVAKIRFDQIPDTECFKRVHITEAGTVAIVDGGVVADVLAQQKKKIESAAGVERLPGTTPGDKD